MKKISMLIQLTALTAGLPAFALTGGPYDNGSYGVLEERAGVYESAYSFKNGSGYSQWTPDNLQGTINAGGQITLNTGTGSLLTAAGNDNNANRTILYYKGVTYFGSAMGQVDTTKRTIQGFGNASSDYSVSATTNTQQAGFFTASSSTAFTSETVVSSGRAYTANVNWTGKITETSPQFRWTGTGELSIIAPNGAESIASLAYSGYQGLIESINTSVARSGAQILFDPATYTAGASAIAEILNGSGGTPASSTPTYTQAVDATGTAVDVNGNGIFNDDLIVSGKTDVAEVPGTPSLLSYLEGTGPDNSYEESAIEKITVTGYRRYF